MSFYEYQRCVEKNISSKIESLENRKNEKLRKTKIEKDPQIFEIEKRKSKGKKPRKSKFEKRKSKIFLKLIHGKNKFMKSIIIVIYNDKWCIKRRRSTFSLVKFVL